MPTVMDRNLTVFLPLGFWGARPLQPFSGPYKTGGSKDWTASTRKEGVLSPEDSPEETKMLLLQMSVCLFASIILRRRA